ncbi:MAG: GTP-binding protein YchF [Candidatus Magnetoglobus multicellularis str. Araruama]|uniref:GTP-binding protein YchF n=1 Tax=Candidatus Magnetoglobus multicellularis str. Araruama TaxID=890399 RepID=A0A1V1PGI1_9BACT|nr:MAG: GTP-binding protein YchF [Candidatus Magnetoglobus multicellularis str. Araruama]
MKLGIIGHPGSGKRTLFEAFTGMSIQASQKQEDLVGTITVPDHRIDHLSQVYQPKKTIYAQVAYHLPAQTGGQKDTQKNDSRWASYRNCDALIHVVRNFKMYGMADPSPEKDYLEMSEDMILADYLVVEKRIERIQKERNKKNVASNELDLLKQCLALLENNQPISNNPDLAKAPELKGFAFLTARPGFVLFNNADEDNALPDLPDCLKHEKVLPIRGKLEQELSQMNEQEAAEFLEEFEISASAMTRIITESYELMGLISFFTVGEDEVRAWTIPRNTPADDAAGAIHTDFKKGFIRAEVLSYEDFIRADSKYAVARKNGTVRLEGKTYIVQDADIIHFRFNV